MSGAGEQKEIAMDALDPTKPPCSAASPDWTFVGLGSDGPMYSNAKTSQTGFCAPGPPDPPPVNDPSFRIGGKTGAQYRVEGTFADRNAATGPIVFGSVAGHPNAALGNFTDVGPSDVSIVVNIDGGIQFDPVTGKWVISTDGSATISVARLSPESFHLKITDTLTGKIWERDFAQDAYLSIVEHAFAA